MSKIIHITKGKTVLVDDDDFISLARRKWHLQSSGYAARFEIINGYRVYILMHREIMNFPGDMHIDHINRNKLDNRKCNLRIVDRFKNLQNTDAYRNNTSGYKGVSWHKQMNKWTARIRVDGKYKSLGLHQKIEDAANAYEEAVKKYRGQL